MDLEVQIYEGPSVPSNKAVQSLKLNFRKRLQNVHIGPLIKIQWPLQGYDIFDPKAN